MYDPSWEEALFVDRVSLDPRARVTPFVAMQRVVIRMLFDPAFVDRVYADANAALTGVDLEPELVEQLLSNDQRLWNADRLRRYRALKILLDEFKVASTLVLHECGKLEFLDAFFSSDIFHAAVQERGYMALAFVKYLEDAFEAGTLSSRHTKAALQLEGEMARSRRELRDARRGYDRAIRQVEGEKTGEHIVAQPGVRATILPRGTLDVIQHIEQYLFQSSQVPALALCDDAPTPDPLPALDDANPVAYLLEPETRGKVDLSGIPLSFAKITAIAVRPVTADEMRTRASEQGIEANDVDDLAGQLIDAGVLRKVRLG